MAEALSVLIIDDDDDVREGLMILLSARGFDMHGVASGSEAIERLAAGLRPSIIVIDLQLAGMTASDFRRAQLLHPAVRGVPVVVLSGADDIRERAAKLSAAAYLTKPVDMDLLAAVLRQHCLR